MKKKKKQLDNVTADYDVMERREQKSKTIARLKW